MTLTNNLDQREHAEEKEEAKSTLEMPLSQKDKELIEERYAGTNFVVEDFVALKILTGNKFDNTIRMYGRKEKNDETWDEGIISKEDLQDITDYVAKLKTKTTEIQDRTVTRIRKITVKEYDTILKLRDQKDMDEMSTDASIATQSKEKGVLQEGGKENISISSDGTGIDLAALENTPAVHEYIGVARKAFRTLIDKQLIDKITNVTAAMKSEDVVKVKEFMQHGEVISEVITDRQIDNLSLSLLNTGLNMLDKHWDDIENVIDTLTKYLPKLLSLYDNNEELIKSLGYTIQKEGADVGDVVKAGTFDELTEKSEKIFESMSNDLNITPEFQEMLGNFVQAPDRIMSLMKARVEHHLPGGKTMETASSEELREAYQKGFNIFNDYNRSSQLMSDIFSDTSKDNIHNEYRDLGDELENSEGVLPSDGQLKDIEGKMNELKPKMEELKDKITKEGGLLSFFQDSEKMSKLNEFARFISGGKETNFISWFKKTVIGKLLMGGLALFEIGTNKKLFDFETAENKEIIKYANKVYMDNNLTSPHKGEGLEEFSLDKASVNDNKIMYINKIEDKKNITFMGISMREKKITSINANPGLTQDQKEATIKELPGEDMTLEKAISENLNLSLLGSIVTQQVMDNSRTTFYQSIHAESPPQGFNKTGSQLMQEYIIKQFPHVLAYYVKGKSKVVLNDERIVTLILQDLLQKKQAYKKLDPAVRTSKAEELSQEEKKAATVANTDPKVSDGSKETPE